MLGEAGHGLSMTLDRVIALSQAQVLKLLRRRLWLQEKLHPTEWQQTLFWAALAGFLGAIAALAFTASTEGVHVLMTGSSGGVVETMRLLPHWVVVLVPGVGGLIAGLILHFGQRLAPGASSTDYMEAISIGSGHIPVRASLVKSAAALFSIGSGGSIGREGPMVQMAAVLSSRLGRWQAFTPPKLRLLVACGAAAGIASAYRAPIGGSFFIAEIILGTIAMETLGPLVIAAVTAALTVRVFSGSNHLYEAPSVRLESAWEMGPYLLLGMVAGSVAPAFLRSLRAAEGAFVASRMPLIVRLTIGGLLVGAVAAAVPEVCGNGYTVVLSILRGEFLWSALLLVLVAKWFATASSFGSGAPGGVFTPTLFMGASVGYLWGTAVHHFWPLGASDPRAFAVVGMGAFLAAASHAPVMAIIMLFEMTLSYDIILPLMLCSVVAYFTAKHLEGDSLYSSALKKKGALSAEQKFRSGIVEHLMRKNPPVVRRSANFAEVGRIFLSESVNNLYVVDEEGRFAGVVAFHDIKPYIQQPELANVVIVSDIMRENFPFVYSHQTLSECLGGFLEVKAERLPVLTTDRRLAGSLAKTDLLLTLSQSSLANAA